MRGVHRDMLEELELLKSRLKELLYENAGELHRTKQLLLDNERKIEEQFAKLDSFQTMREEIGKKMRKRVAHAVAGRGAKPIAVAPGHSNMTGQAGIASPTPGAAFSSQSRRAKRRDVKSRFKLISPV